MKRTLIVCCTVLAMVAAPLVRAEGSLTDAQLDAIRSNCVNAQVVLQRVQESDKLTRINRGYKYETMSKLMVSFNSRAALNKINAPEILSITSDYQKLLDLFRAEYTSYDDTMTSLTQLDCRNQPTTFNDLLISLRSKRTLLGTRVAEFDALLDNYQKNLDMISQRLGVKQ